MRTFLFAGHMIDAPGRTTPRFPATAVPSARQAIERILDSLISTPEDLAISSGACGGDLLFAQTVLVRGLRLLLPLPFEERRFLQESVSFAGKEWADAFAAVRRNARTRVVVLDDPGDTASTAASSYERLNQWLLNAAFAHEPGKIHLICLWSGTPGDGPGGTGELVAEVLRRGGRVHWIDTREL